MKIHGFALVAALLGSTAFAQTNTYPFPASGSVGIGTSSPASHLDINAMTPVLTLTPSAYSGSYRTTLGTRAGAQGFLIFGNNGQNEIRAGRSAGGGYLDFYTNNTIDQFGDSDGNFAVRMAVNGNMGIGTAAPSNKLEVAGAGEFSSGGSYIPGTAMVDWTGLRVEHDEATNTSNPTGLNLAINRANPTAAIRNNHPNAPALLIEAGNVGIGTTNPQHKLAVNGTIKAKEVIVETTGWSDYVLADNYALQPLNEVEAHIKMNKHLPGIPSAAQVAEQGISIGDMQAKLLAKIEELTLHQIAQEKLLKAQATELKAQLAAQADELTSLRAEVRASRK